MILPRHITVPALSAIVVAGAVFGVAQSGAEQSRVEHSSQLSASAVDEPLADLSAALAQDHIYLEPFADTAQSAQGGGMRANPGSGPDPISSGAAVTNAQRELTLLGSSSPTAVLQNFTDADYGTETQPDEQLPSAVSPAFSDRPAWVLSFPGVELPVSAPEGMGDSPPSYTATQVVFIDAYSGEFLEAQSIN
ncbi:MAG: hypothetical protein ACR2KL_12800 [Nocardioidaceae bacterium]